MEAEELTLDTKVARVLKHSENDVSVEYGVVSGKVAQRKNYAGKLQTFAMITFTTTYENCDPNVWDENCPIEELVSEEEGKLAEEEFNKKLAALEDEFNFVKGQVLEKAQAAAVLVEEANTLLKGIKELSDLTYLTEVAQLRTAMQKGGWMVSTVNC